MHKTILILFLCMPTLCIAQPPKIDFALSVPLYIRQSENHVDPFRYWFGATGVEGVLRVNGTDETAMPFFLNVGITNDIWKSSIATTAMVKTSLSFLNINPSIALPSRSPHIQFCLGVGTLIRLRQSIGFRWGSSASGSYTTVDSLNKFTNANSRSVLPYISFGMAEDIGKHLRIEFTFRPALLNLYEPGNSINLSNNPGTPGGGTVFALNYRPVYGGFRFFYFFKARG
ncbi:MAG: hypothetical protein P4L41_02020 [Flavipsychrobacter sp.]|nr:hypothetical protein [Flavipsychrobacter sp.]